MKALTPFLLSLLASTADAHCMFSSLFPTYLNTPKTAHTHRHPRNISLTNKIFTDRFSKLIVNGVEEAKEWGYVRQTKNYQTNAGVTDVNSADIRCFQNRPGTSTASVQAGTKLGFVAMSAVTHFGPVSFYMAKVPEGRDINTWDGAGNVWFKVGEISAPSSGVLGSGVETWPAYSEFNHLPT